MARKGRVEATKGKRCGSRCCEKTSRSSSEPERGTRGRQGSGADKRALVGTSEEVFGAGEMREKQCVEHDSGRTDLVIAGP